MAKKSNMGLFIVIGIIGVLLYSMDALPFMSITQNNDEFIQSDYIVKYYYTTNNVDNISDMNLLLVFDDTIVLSDDLKAQIQDVYLSAQSNDPNKIIFTDALLNKINKKSFTSTDLRAAISEVDPLFDRVCNNIPYITQNSPYYIRLSQIRGLNKTCSMKQDDIVTVKGSGYTIRLPDVYSYSEDYTCTTTDPACTEGCNQICLPNGQYTEERLRHSTIPIEVSVDKGDYFIAIGQVAINEVSHIEGKYDFSQYAYEIEHSHNNQFYNGTMYSVQSNSAEVISASNGIIKEATYLEDLWTGIQSGEALNDTSFLMIAGGVLLVILLIMKK